MTSVLDDESNIVCLGEREGLLYMMRLRHVHGVVYVVAKGARLLNGCPWVATLIEEEGIHDG